MVFARHSPSLLDKAAGFVHQRLGPFQIIAIFFGNTGVDKVRQRILDRGEFAAGDMGFEPGLLFRCKCHASKRTISQRYAPVFRRLVQLVLKLLDRLGDTAGAGVGRFGFGNGADVFLAMAGRQGVETCA